MTRLTVLTALIAAGLCAVNVQADCCCATATTTYYQPSTVYYAPAPATTTVSYAPAPAATTVYYAPTPATAYYRAPLQSIVAGRPVYYSATAPVYYNVGYRPAYYGW